MQIAAISEDYRNIEILTFNNFSISNPFQLKMFNWGNKWDQSSLAKVRDEVFAKTGPIGKLESKLADFKFTIFL